MLTFLFLLLPTSIGSNDGAARAAAEIKCVKADGISLLSSGTVFFLLFLFFLFFYLFDLFDLLDLPDLI